MTEQNEKKVPRMLTVRETAKLFKDNGSGITESYLRKGVKHGTISHVKSGVHVLINVDRLIDQLNGVEEDDEEAI